MRRVAVTGIGVDTLADRQDTRRSRVLSTTFGEA